MYRIGFACHSVGLLAGPNRLALQSARPGYQNESTSTSLTFTEEPVGSADLATFVA
jgi:hypothetical protein